MQLAITGQVIGSIIAITAIGLSMICKTLNFVTFAHGDFVAFAAYIALFANTSGMHLAIRFSGRDTCNHRARGFHGEGGMAL